MQTEDNVNIKQSVITLHTKDKGVLLYLQLSIQRRYLRHDIIHITEEHMSFISADTINKLFILPCSWLALKHSVTFLIISHW